jgi:hypothetical protein
MNPAVLRRTLEHIADLLGSLGDHVEDLAAVAHDAHDRGGLLDAHGAVRAAVAETVRAAEIVRTVCELPHATGPGLWTCVVRCAVCGAELRRATHVPTVARPAMERSAPYIAFCAVREHNTRTGPTLRFDWIEEGSL